MVQVLSTANPRVVRPDEDQRSTFTSYDCRVAPARAVSPGNKVVSARYVSKENNTFVLLTRGVVFQTRCHCSCFEATAVALGGASAVRARCLEHESTPPRLTRLRGA